MAKGRRNEGSVSRGRSWGVWFAERGRPSVSKGETHSRDRNPNVAGKGQLEPLDDAEAAGQVQRLTGQCRNELECAKARGAAGAEALVHEPPPHPPTRLQGVNEDRPDARA